MIELIALDQNGHVDYTRDFDTMKEARSFVKEAMLDAKFWDRRAELDGYYMNIASIQLVVDGEIVQDWFPKWVK